MKKVLVIVMLCFSIAAFSKTSAFASEDMWISLGYNYYIPEKSGGKSPDGPVNMTIGGQITDWVALDFMIGYMWGLKEKDDLTKPATDIDSLPIRLHFMIHPWFDVNYFNIAPYIGIGPSIAVNGTDFANNNFSYGFSAKAGVRFEENGFLFGIGAEYIYNPLDVKSNGVTYKYNTSGFSVGGEIGFAF